MSKPRIVILATGGTIAGVETQPGTGSYRSAALPVETLLQAIPMMADVADIQTEQVAQLDSKDMTADVWRRLDQRIRFWRESGTVDGIVITHGTDTLEETAMVLHLTQPIGIPMVLTAAMRPATAVSADGPANLLQAVRVAAHPDSAAYGVLVVINQEIHAARDVAKVHATALHAFASPGCGPVGVVVGPAIRYSRRPEQASGVGGRLLGIPDPLPWVEIVVSAAGARRHLIDALVEQGVQGLVIAAPGNGSVHEALLPALADAGQRGVSVVRSSRSGVGFVSSIAATTVTPGQASVGRFPATADLNPWKARVALMLALGATEATFSANPPEPGALQRFFDAI